MLLKHDQTTFFQKYFKAVFTSNVSSHWNRLNSKCSSSSSYSLCMKCGAINLIDKNILAICSKGLHFDMIYMPLYALFHYIIDIFCCKRRVISTDLLTGEKLIEIIFQKYFVKLKVNNALLSRFSEMSRFVIKKYILW